MGLLFLFFYEIIWLLAESDPFFGAFVEGQRTMFSAAARKFRPFRKLECLQRLS